MTEEEKTLIDQRAGFYHAPEKQTPVNTKNKNASGAFCAVLGCTLVLMTVIPRLTEEDMSGLEGIRRAAAEVCLLSARAELIHADFFPREEFSSLPEDKPTENGNNTYSPELELLEMSRLKIPSSFNEEIYTDELLPPPAAEIGDWEPNGGTIIRKFFGRQSGDSFIDLPMGGQLRNAAGVSEEIINNAALSSPDLKIKLSAEKDEPQVLIMHTHTTESYEQTENAIYSLDYPCRTTDNSMNMTRVGEKMAEVFEEKGIRTLHDTTVHDYPSYNGSYDRSRETVSALLKKYPSVKVVLDVHRDAIENAAGDRTAPCTLIDGKSCAQVMLICCCDDGSGNMPRYKENLSAAILFQQFMEKAHPGLTRPLLFDRRNYNQDLTTGSLLIEIGGHANSIDEAEYAGQLAAEGIAEALISVSEEEK